MGPQRYSFLCLMSIVNDTVETLTVTYREKGERGDVPRQRVIKRLKLHKSKRL